MASQYNRVNVATVTGGANGTGIVTYSFHMIGSGTFKYIRILFQNIAWTSATGPQNVGNPITFTDVLISKGFTFAPVRVKYNGVAITSGNSITLADGQKDVLSDRIYPSDLGLSSFAVGQELRVTTYGNVGSGLKFPILSGTDSTYVEGNTFDPTVTTPIITNAGTPTFTGTAPTTSFGFAPLVVGQFVSGDPYTWFGAGDSIIAQGGRSSYFMRALRTGGLAGVQVGRVGGVQDSITSTAGVNLLKYCSGALDEYDTNYIGSRTLGQLQTLNQTAWANLRANAIVSPAGKPFKIIRTGLLVHTSGAWTLPDFSDQTVLSGWGAGELVEQVNSWYASQAGGAIDAYIDVSPAVRADVSGANFYKWKAPGYTNDGLHPTSTGSDPMGDILAAALPV